MKLKRINSDALVGSIKKTIINITDSAFKNAPKYDFYRCGVYSDTEGDIHFEFLVVDARGVFKVIEYVYYQDLDEFIPITNHFAFEKNYEVDNYLLDLIDILNTFYDKGYPLSKVYFDCIQSNDSRKELKVFLSEDSANAGEYKAYFQSMSESVYMSYCINESRVVCTQYNKASELADYWIR